MSLFLAEPSEKYLSSFLESLTEDESEGIFSHHHGQSHEQIRAHPEKFLKSLKEGSVRYSPNRVPQTDFWAIVDNQYVGRISIRKSLTRWLSEYGGHIGYEVRPSARRKGYASAMLKAAVPRAYDMGLLRVMITCKESNTASQKVIEKSGAHRISNLFNQAENSQMLRYWLPTYSASETLQEAIHDSIAYLESPAAESDVARDPYWPKWNSPWWHMHCLREIGLAHLIPKNLLHRLFHTMNTCYLPGFPFSEADLPADADPYRSTQCHCQKGCFVQLAIDCQENIDDVMTDAIHWFAQYQLPDGGLNCDNEAYLRERPVSSFVSSAPVLEALLECELLGAKIPEGIVDRVAQYFIDRKLHRSLRTGQSAQPAWCQNIFPRFYEYDLLRGVEALTEWMHRREKKIDAEWFKETVALIFNAEDSSASGGGMRTHHDSFSIHPQPDGHWTNGRSTSFPLLDLLSRKECADIFLEAHRNRVRANLHALNALP